MIKFNQDIMKLAKENESFRKEIVTGDHSQVVLMSILQGDDIGEEVHEVDQIIVLVQGEGNVISNGNTEPVKTGHLVFVPAGTTHNFTNTGGGDMKLISIYSPPEHAPGTVNATKQDAEIEEQVEQPI